MTFALRQSIKIALAGLILLLLSLSVSYKYSYDTLIHEKLELYKISTKQNANNININLIEKVKTNKAISITPLIIKTLTSSNDEYDRLDSSSIKTKIKEYDKKWIGIKTDEDPFIQSFTNNPVSNYLKTIQESLPGEYGEIFITNKYGAIIASTSKLSTFAHAHKYWWQGAYSNGNGVIYFDDRGYDESVGNYVLGVVIPIKINNEIIGIIKANLNILGSISNILKNSKNRDDLKLRLVRSGGLIISEEGFDPLSTSISDNILNNIKQSDEGSFILKSNTQDELVAFSVIELSKNSKDYVFGGSNQSLDHKHGNAGEYWYLVQSTAISNISDTLMGKYRIMIIIGFLFLILIIIISWYLGLSIKNPINNLVDQTNKIIEGDYNVRINSTRNDEFRLLGDTFNKMTSYLVEKTTSIENLNKEKIVRWKVEEELRVNESRYKKAQALGHVGNWEYDLETIIFWASDEAKKIYGFNHDSESFSTEEVEKCIPDRIRVHQALIDLIENNKEYNLKFDLITNDTGERRTIHSIAELERDNSGKPLKVSGVVNDITQLMKAEQELTKYRNNLEELVKERTYELEERTKELEEKNEKLSKYNKLFVDREFRVKELKDKIKELELNQNKE